MKIIAIRVKNLASLEHAVVDFTQEPLATAGLFAITGRTGSGKSTLLDALCLALYGTTPRYKKVENIAIRDIDGTPILQGDVRGILRDGTGEGFAEVDFHSVNGELFRATWMVRRARQKADGSLQDAKMALKNLTTGQDIPGRKTELLAEIERLVGLSFDQFTRSVLLAQGDFTAFLKADKDEKASLLEKLTGTEIYSKISRRIYEKYKEADQQLNNLIGQTGHIKILSDEEVDQLTAQKNKLHQTIDVNEKVLQALKTEIEWHEQLSTYMTKHEEAVDLFEQAKMAKENAKPRKQKLDFILSAQVVRGNVDILLQSRKEKEKNIESIDALTSQTAEIDIALDSCEQAIESAKTNLSLAEQAEQQAADDLQKARSIDAQINSLRIHLSNVKKEVEDQKEKMEKLTDDLKEEKKQIQKKEEKLTELNKWFDSNKGKEKVATESKWILQRLVDGEEHVKTIPFLNEKLAGFKQKFDDLEKQEDNAFKEYYLQSSDQTSKDALREQLDLYSINQWEEKLQQTRNQKDLLDQARTTWEPIHRLLTDIQSLHNDAELLTVKINRDEKHWQDEANTLPVLEGKYKGAEAALLKAKLVASESVQQLRAELEDGKPCLICGSVDHPIKGQHVAVDNMLDALEGSFQEAKNQYEETRSRLISLKERINQQKNQLGNIEKTILDKANQKEQYWKEWEQTDLYPSCSSMLADSIEAYLITSIKEITSSEKRLLQIVKLRGSIDRILVEKEKLLADHEQNESQLQNANNKLLDIKATLEGLFESDKWFDNWINKADQFKESIKSFAADWQVKSKELEEVNVAIVQKQSEINGKSLVLREVEKEYHASSSKLESQEKDLATFHDQRSTLFNGENVVVVEDKLKKAIKSARHDLDLAKEGKEKLVSKKIENSTTVKGLQDANVQLDERISNMNETIERWLEVETTKTQIDLSIDDLVEAYAFDASWIDAEKNRLDEIDVEVVRKETSLKLAQETLAKHRDNQESNRGLDELTTLKDATSASVDADKELSTALTLKLVADREARIQLGAIQDQISDQQLVVEKWAKLNDIIGSSDGKKFRQIAQEYTLDVLLSYANIHLQMLSKRYSLQRTPEALGLQMVDKDMGNEIRAVYSLSGGESFLISLALALGLASLSSNEMNVESLFIDEGFGSLDPITLVIAMDALERLHSQGRKVGVISHVQEMTERIPVQIQVQQLQNGKSTVSVFRSGN